MISTTIVKYNHHGKDVFVRGVLKGQHRDHCLCFQGCTRFKPGTVDNCEIAQSVYDNCVKHNIVSPVWECPKFTTE